jgi:basic amino acid/polyamine antiporter, APA family
MADQAPEMKATLGLTGLTMNAMALIAPGALFWLTFAPQAVEGATAPSMWIGVAFALLLSLGTALCYAEMAKLYPGTGSSYYFAEQSFLNHERTWKYARVSKFIVGWGSHLYYWIYSGVMVAFTGIICGYVAGTLWPSFMSANNPGPVFMMLVAIVFSFLIAYIAHRGINGSTSVNIAINVIQISALLIFAVLAFGYRSTHPSGTPGWQFDTTSGDAYTYKFQTEKVTANGVTADSIVRDSAGVPKPQLGADGKALPFIVQYPDKDEKGNFLSHRSASSVVGMHNFAWMFIQATVAILLLVGFESVTAMGGEAKNAKRDVPIAVFTSLVVQGAFCLFIAYFAGNYFLNSGYTMQNASGSSAPVGDMMVIIGNHYFGQGGGRIFMLVEALTVLIALIGTTLSCMNTGARVTYAMGKDGEIGGNLGLLHPDNLTPHYAIWALAAISAAVGCISLVMVFGDGAAMSDAAIKALPRGFFSSFGYPSHDVMAAMPNSLLTMTLASNFGTFVLYALSCVICIVAFHKHVMYNLVKHLLIPLLALVANLACMAFYLIGPFMGYGTRMEPLVALGIAAAWGIYGAVYFVSTSKKKGRVTVVPRRDQPSELNALELPEA